MTDLAIVGVACRFPGENDDFQSFFSSLEGKKDCITSVPSDKYNATYFTKNGEKQLGKITANRMGSLKDANKFDGDAFGLSKKEVENLDPQQKMLCEVALQALEDSGLNYRGSAMGCFVGIGQAEQLGLSTYDLESINQYSVTGSALSIASNRVSFLFDLRGPSLSVDTACSSAGTAFHLARLALLRGECDSALVGGVNILQDPAVMIQFSQLGVLSAEGRCASFSSDANGYVRSEGCSLVVLQRLDVAQREGNHIYCVVKGTAANQDGRQSPSLTMPSGPAQRQLFETVCREARVNPHDIFFAEAHATGTAVGDPVEANAIGSVLGQGRSASTRHPKLRIGSVKTNVGHLETASFMAGLIKCVGQLYYKRLVPNLHFTSGNPAIRFDEYNMQVQTEVEQFEGKNETMLISSFGFGGSNSAVILEGYENESKTASKETGSGKRLLMVSAATTASLEARISELKSLPSSLSLEDVAATLFSRSLHRHYSFAITHELNDKTEFAPFRKLMEAAPFSAASPILGASSSPVPPIIFVFAGQGPQHPNMGRSLYAGSSVFRQSIDESDAIYRECSGKSLLSDIGIFGSHVGDPKAVYELNYTLPGLVCLQMGLVDVLFALGVRPAAVFGHSFGEMAAGYAAGIVSRRQCVETAFHRARLLSQIDGKGGMMAIGCSEQDIQPLLDQHEQVWIAAYNGPNSLTLGGIHSSISLIAEELKKKGVFNRVLNINNAYHTPLLNSVKEETIRAFQVTLNGVADAQVPYFSTVTGQWKQSEFDAKYSWDGIEGAVRFESAVKGCLKEFGDETAVFLEISAHPVLQAYLKENGAKRCVSTLSREGDEVESMLKMAANLRGFGVAASRVDVSKLVGVEGKRLAAFLPYPFQREFCVREDATHRANRLVPQFKSLAGRPLPHPSPAWQQKLSLPLFPWIVDHVVQGPPVFPAAGFIEMFFQLTEKIELENIKIDKALVMPDANLYRAVRSVSTTEKTIQSWSIFSKQHEQDDEPWRLHCSASAVSGAQYPTHDASVFSDWKAACDAGKQFNPSQIYGRFSMLGLMYGPHFQLLESLSVDWKNSRCVAVLDVARLIAMDSLSATEFHVPPPVLDCCFQALLGTHRFLFQAYVPTRIDYLTWRTAAANLPSKVLVFAQLTGNPHFSVDSAKAKLQGDVFVFTPEMVPVGEIRGFQATPLGVPQEKQPLHTYIWQSHVSPEVTDQWREDDLQKLSDHLAVPIAMKPKEELFVQACLYYVQNFRERKLFDEATVATWSEHRQRYWKWLHSLPASSYKPQAEPASTPVALPAELLSELKAAPELHLELEAIRRVGENLPSLLTDPFSVQHIFFGENDSFMSDLYSKASTFGPFVDLLAQHLVDRILESESSSDRRVFSILELGAGTGGLTRTLLGRIAQHTTLLQEKRLVYYFTDVTPKFLADAKKTFANVGGMEFRLLNLDEGLPEGIPLGFFDYVLGFDVVHVAQRLSPALQKIKKLLAPGGTMIAIELTRPWLWLELFFGLFAGWWHFQDVELRSKCFLKCAEWEKILVTEGFQKVRVWNEEAEGQEFGHSLVFASNSVSNTHAEETKIFDVTDVTATTYEASLDKLLQYAQNIDATSNLPQLVVSKWTGADDEAEELTFGSIFTGFARVWANEMPQLKIASLSLDSAGLKEKDTYIKAVLDLLELGEEREFIVQNGQIKVPRLIPAKAEASNEEEKGTVRIHLSSESAAPSLPYRVEVSVPGQLQTLQYRHFLPTPLLPNQVRCRVSASSLNFKDLMLALEMLSNPLQLPPEIFLYGPAASGVPLGLEFAGEVLEIGSEVKHVAVGDRVYGLAENSFASEVVTKMEFVVRQPTLQFDQTPIGNDLMLATVPIVYITTYAGLIAKAQLQPGEAVLVHSAAGAVGQAAIQLCKMLGCRVIASVGSAEKRAFLNKKYGLTEFCSSHDVLEWEKEVMQLTNGQGVDVVLNSLKGEAISAGLRCLRVSGRFVEIGKIDILEGNPLSMNLLLRDISFHSVQVDILLDKHASRVQHYLQCVNELLNAGKIAPIHTDSVFDVNGVENAFRHMMKGLHMGKIVLNLTEKPATILAPSSIYNAQTCYVLSGGTGALGFELIKHIAQHGGKQFVLLSRSGKEALSPSQLEWMDKLRAHPVNLQVHVAKSDCSSASSVQAAVAEATQVFGANFGCEGYGIFHLAMVLDDAPISKLTPDRMHSVVQAKVRGALSLLSAFNPAKIRSVVFFSSAASVFGNPSQANYSAANTFLDDYATYLQTKGVAAFVVNLGMVEDVGILAEDYKLKQILRQKGFTTGLNSQQVCEMIDYLMTQAAAQNRTKTPSTPVQFVQGSFQFADLITTYPFMRTRLRHLLEPVGSGSAGGADLGSELTLDVLVEFIRAQLDAKSIDPNEALNLQGLDSLMAVELSAGLKKKLNINVSQMALLGGLSVKQLFEKHQQV